MSPRPTATVIVPFAGLQGELERLVARLEGLRLRDGDEVIVADNRRRFGRVSCGARGQVCVCAAAGLRSPAFARNRGAEIARGEWLVFIDADTTPASSLLDDYFEPPPDGRTAILAGGIVDVAQRATLAARHSANRGQMSARTTLERPHHPYAQTANCAVRRTAFEQVSGFTEEIRAGEDADLCFRLQRVGWLLEVRPNATVEHRGRETLRGLIGQLARHGSGAAWLQCRYPGSFPPPSAQALAGRITRSGQSALTALARREREQATCAVLDILTACAFELGRLLPNRARRD